jgi:hypothetical protein
MPRLNNIAAFPVCPTSTQRPAQHPAQRPDSPELRPLRSVYRDSRTQEAVADRPSLPPYAAKRFLHPEASRGSILVPPRGWIASGECRHSAKVLSQSRPE